MDRGCFFETSAKNLPLIKKTPEGSEGFIIGGGRLLLERSDYFVCIYTYMFVGILHIYICICIYIYIYTYIYMFICKYMCVHIQILYTPLHVSEAQEVLRHFQEASELPPEQLKEPQRPRPGLGPGGGALALAPRDGFLTLDGGIGLL